MSLAELSSSFVRNLFVRFLFLGLRRKHQQEFHFAPGAPGASDPSGAPGANRCSGCVVAYSFRPDAYPTRPGAPDAPGRQPPSTLHLLSALDFC